MPRTRVGTGGFSDALAHRVTSSVLENDLLLTISHAQLGDHDRAFRMIEEALERKDNLVVFLVASPLIDPIRSDPRYGRFLDRLGVSR